MDKRRYLVAMEPDHQRAVGALNQHVISRRNDGFLRPEESHLGAERQEGFQVWTFHMGESSRVVRCASNHHLCFPRRRRALPIPKRRTAWSLDCFEPGKPGALAGQQLRYGCQVSLQSVG